MDVVNNQGRSRCVEALAYCYGFNVLMLMVVGHGYLASVPSGTSTLGWLAMLLAFVANFAVLALAPAMLAAVAILTRRLWITLTAAIILYGLFNVFIYADSVIYQLWRFHFNSMVFNLLTTQGAGDSVIAGRGTVLYTTLIVVTIFAAEIGFALYVLPFLRRRTVAIRLRTKRALLVSCSAVFALIVLDKAVYGVGDLRNNVELLRVKQIMPLYQSVTMKKFAIKVLGRKPSHTLNFKVRGGSGSFDYPKSPLRFRADGPRPNIVVVSVEGGRFDMVTPEVMPFLSRWGAENLVFEQNYSAGNTTRYGIFGLIHGIYGTYWRRALTERRGPVLIRSLKQLGYNIRILSCTDLHYPEFRSTCFVDVPEAITDHWSGDRIHRDRQMTDTFVQFLDTKRTPFFAFLFYDASHQPYHYPPSHAVFNVGGVTEDLNYIKLAHAPAEMEFIKNRYKNSLHYVDSEIERAFQALEARDMMRDTLIFVMGDHGEEFRELGLFGHDSTFDKYQTKTFMVARIPGQIPRRIQRVTNHMDVPSTILSYLGAENPLSDYTQGMPLLSSQERSFVFISSWDTAAIENGKTTTVFGTETYRTELTIYDQNYAPLPNQRDALAAHKDVLLEALSGMRQFTK